MEDERTFTQAEVNAIVERRLARQRAKFEQEIASLTQSPSDATESDTAVEIQPEVPEADMAEAQAAVLQSTIDLQAARLKAAIQVEAIKQGAIDPDAVAAMLDLTSIEHNDDGAPNNIDGLVGTLLRQKPYLQGGRPKVAGVDQGARPSVATSEHEALRLMETDPVRFDRMVRSGAIPRDVFAGR